MLGLDSTREAAEAARAGSVPYIYMEGVRLRRC
jgi:hypothetical protein